MYLRHDNREYIASIIEALPLYRACLSANHANVAASLAGEGAASSSGWAPRTIPAIGLPMD